jgi:peptidoglycan/LPS O-acetylase OafA/YrhL
VLTAAVWTVTTVTVATLTHRLVELPAVRLGRALGNRPGRPAVAAVPPAPGATGHPVPRPALSAATAGSRS